MKKYRLLTSYKAGEVELKNHVVMSPMTRSRATGNIPNELMANYYGQRSGAGLIVTEGTSPSPNGLGYTRIPGIFSNSQVEGWKKITSSVHKVGGKIFVQLMHTGRINHPLNLPEGARILAPSSVKAKGQIWTDSKQLQDYPMPQEMTVMDIEEARKEYETAAKNAKEAGGYTLERAESDIISGLGDLIAFGRPFINNPDLVERFRNRWPLSGNLDPRLFYTPGENGYTDYPVYEG
jgi:N-ethylmaleimide reductase